MISKKLVYGLILLVALGLAIGTCLVRSNHDKNKNLSSKKVEASSSQAVLTSQSDWDAGSKDNIDSSSSSGSVKILSLAGGKLDLSGKTVTADPDTNKSNAVDSDQCGTFWTSARGPGHTQWMIDLGDIMNVMPKITRWGVGPLCNMQTSTNGSSWTNYVPDQNSTAECGIGAPTCSSSTPLQLRYLKIYCDFTEYCDGSNCSPAFIHDVQFTTVGATATHTSGSTQLNGGTDFYEWQTFTPTYTKPANTNVQYRFRSSTNSTDWTSWTDYQTPSSGSPLDITSLVTSRTGPTDSPTLYKYLQVETKLTSTDGNSNPTLSDYSIGYHTNRPPDKPVAGTVIIGN